MMDFRFTEDQQDLIYAAKAVFDGENTVERMRKIAAGDQVDNLWPTFAELGLIGLMANEDKGGLEQPLVVMAGIAEAAGYAGLPEPLIELAGVTLPLLDEVGETDAFDGLISGEKPVGLITPLLPNVGWANFCEEFVVTSESGAKLVSEDDITIEELNSIDPLRKIFKTSETGDHNALVDHAGITLCAAQLVGLSQRMLDMSVEYANTREQFGKPIGSFQAIKHHLATLHTQIAFTRPVVHLAAIKGGAAMHHAKIRAIDTAMLAAETAIQVHGGMGYTFEVDLHLFMKRAWALCGEWGDRNYHMNKLEELILDGDLALGAGETFN